MKNLLGMGLAAALLAALLGCAPKSQTPAGGPEKLKVGIVYDTGGIGDKSFNDSAAQGIEKAKSDLGVEVVQIESKDVKDYASNLRELAEKGCKIVFAVGINMQDALTTVAGEFPNTKFAIIDGDVAAPNVRCLKFKEEEGSFLVGYLAGLMTKTNKLGFVGGQKIPLIEKFQFGYQAGAKTANPNVTILEPKYVGSWDDIDTAKVTANILFAGGADIVYHAAGRAGLGVIRAAAANKKFAIGVDGDQDGVEPGFVLTSMIKHVDVSVFETISELKDGKFEAGAHVYDLKSGGVGYSSLSYTKDRVGAENLSKLEAVKQLVIDGKIVVPTTPAEYDAFLTRPLSH